MLKVLSIIGTRPEAIKMVPVIRELERHPQQIQSVVCVTGQHREMLDQVLRIFEVRPDHDLGLMQPSQTLAGLTARAILAIDAVLEQEQPDWVLVQGDTTTVMAASLAAFYRRIKVGHIEAGLRSGDKFAPFPEEINRRVSDLLADLYFAPTAHSQANLLREGIPAERAMITGNTVIDALIATVRYLDAHEPDLSVPVGPDQRMILVTAHRRENFGAPFAAICAALRTIAQRYADVQLVYPVHHNPNISGPARALLGDLANIHLIPPVDYLTMVQLMRRAHLILTDSGGVQEEAPTLNRPVLILRDVTERQEVVELGAARLVGSDTATIIRETARLFDDPAAYRQMAAVPNPYGDGGASQRIVAALLNAGR